MSTDFSALGKQKTSQYFLDEHVAEEGERYVGWIATMGSRDHLRRDPTAPAVHRGELLAVVSAYTDPEVVDVYAVGHGVLVVSEDETYLREFLDNLLLHYARFNVYEWSGAQDVRPARLIRAGIGHGPVHYVDVERYEEMSDGGETFPADFDNPPFGPAVIRAFEAERGAPLSIHSRDSDGAMGPRYWWKSTDLTYDSRVTLLNMLHDYFDWHVDEDDLDYAPYESDHNLHAIDYFDVRIDDLDSDLVI